MMLLTFPSLSINPCMHLDHAIYVCRVKRFLGLPDIQGEVGSVVSIVAVVVVDSAVVSIVAVVVVDSAVVGIVGVVVVDSVVDDCPDAYKKRDFY